MKFPFVNFSAMIHFNALLLNFHAAWFSLYPKQRGDGSCTPPGIFSSTHGIKLQPRPDVHLEKI